MIPEKNSPIVEIPLTFDSQSKPQGLDNSKFLLALLVFGVWLFISIISIFTEYTIIQKVLFIVISFIVGLYIVRYLIMREPYFRKKREDLIDKNYEYPYSIFWNIYEVTKSYPYICRYANGLKSIFVAFDKDVIVGKDRDNEYWHYEAISDAYLQMHKRGIDCIHIDYMDVVGKDDRMTNLFNLANDAENDDLREILTRMYDNVEYIMQHSYAAYDVYCFFYNGKDELFMDELDIVINAFLEANYIRCRVLDKEEIGMLVKSIFNIEKFSVNEASEKLFSDLGGTHYITPIWIERGEERKILHKTREEIEAEKRVKEAETYLRNSRVRQSGMKKKMKKLKDEENIELFQDEGMDDFNNGYQNNGFMGGQIRQEENMIDFNSGYGNNVVQERKPMGYQEGPQVSMEQQVNRKKIDDDEDIDLF